MARSTQSRSAQALKSPPTPSASVDGQASAPETQRSRKRRGAHRARLYFYAFAAVAMLIYTVAFAVSNTGRVHVDWVFATSSVPLVWLVLLTAILGWLIGLVLSAGLRWRTRRTTRR
jgi:uncharacterized integral membrane protein